MANVWALARYPAGSEELEQALLQGWEPFAVSWEYSTPGSPKATVWLKNVNYMELPMWQPGEGTA